MKIKRENLVALWGLINRLTGEKTTVKFHYLMLKNKRLMESEIKSIQEAQQPPEGYMDFEKKRMELCMEMCEKQENGQPKVKDANFVIPESAKATFNEKLDALKAEYKEAIDKVGDVRNQFATLLEEEVEIPLERIPMSITPQTMLGGDVEMLYDLIDGDK